MSVSQEQFDAAQQQLVDDTAVIHQFVTADQTTTIDAGNGNTIPSLAKVIHDAVGSLDNLATKDGSNASGTWPVDISGTAANATNAANATHATTADSASNAGHATSADSATNASHATNADHATTADTVTTITQSQVNAALGGAPIMASTKGQANGVCGLDGNGLVASVNLPSYVDDVIESDTKALLPATGERGKIYVVIADETRSNSTTQYRWTGSTYARIVSAPGSTDEVAEGTNNLYFTQARVLATGLSGFAATNSAVVAADTVLAAMGKLQGQITANKLTNTDGLTEGATNLYFTQARAIAALLPGLTTPNTGVSASDTVLAAIGKLQGQVTANKLVNTDGLTEGATNQYFTQARVRATPLTGLVLSPATAVTATDTVVVAVGKLQAQITATAGNFTGIPYDMVGGCTGKPAVSANLMPLIVARACNVAANFSLSRAYVATAPAATATFTVKKNGVQVGTFTFNAGVTSASFSGAAFSLAAGDLLDVIAPATQDASLSDMRITIVSTLA